MTNEELKEIHKIIIAAWNYLKEHSDVNGSDEYWKKIIDDSEALMEEFRNPLLDDFIIAINKYLDNFWRKNGNN